jgi:NAD(P)-dependent dehydrogenase (short-subunit alcohol dehydrogenase family)
MKVKPEYIRPNNKGASKIEGRATLITGGDGGIGRSIGVHFAREGCDVAISYLKEEEKDANSTKELFEKAGHKCLLLPGDMRDKNYCNEIVEKTVSEFGKLNILVNNAGINKTVDDFTQLTDEDIEEVFYVNLKSQFRKSRAA